MTPEDIERMNELQKRAQQGLLGDNESKALVRLRLAIRREVAQQHALELFEQAATVWRVSYPEVEDECFPFFALRRVTAEREMRFWGMDGLLLLEEIDRSMVQGAVRYEPSSDCFYFDRRPTEPDLTHDAS
jgi:hypothetical protein